MTTVVRFAALLSVVFSALAIAAQNATPAEPHGNVAQKIDVHIKIKAPNGRPLPSGGKIEVKKAEDSCNSLSQGQPILGGEVTFLDLPVCTVSFDIFVTGFNVNRKRVDLRTYREPMEIRISKDGSPQVSMGPKTTENADVGATVGPSH
jgi:hypothetical protein